MALPTAMGMDYESTMYVLMSLKPTESANGTKSV